MRSVNRRLITTKLLLLKEHFYISFKGIASLDCPDNFSSGPNALFSFPLFGQYNVYHKDPKANTIIITTAIAIISSPLARVLGLDQPVRPLRKLVM